MRLIPFLADAPSSPLPAPRDRHEEDLATLLLGEAGAPLPLPGIGDLLSGVLALADGKRDKALLPLGTTPAELVLVRSGHDALVSYYLLRDTPVVVVLDRRIPFAALLTACARAGRALGKSDPDPVSRDVTLGLAERASQTKLSAARAKNPHVIRRGGAQERPAAGVPLAFGFEAAIPSAAEWRRNLGAHSDTHALLFGGELFLFTRGRRIFVLKGPIMLAITRMVAAARAIVEAHEDARPANVRLRAATFTVGMRLRATGPEPVQLTLGADGVDKVTVPALSIKQAILPILRLASDAIRALVSVDRAQARNLRVTSLRDEVRRLRRRVRGDGAGRAQKAVVHDDPESLRATLALDRSSEKGELTPAPRSLRFDVRWESEVEGLDASSTFLCGDSLVVATPRFVVAMARDDGSVLWARDSAASVSFMTGTVLARLASDGELTLTNVLDGDTFATVELAPRTAGPPAGILAGGGGIPPIAVVSEGADRLSAIDLRNGERRWCFTAQAAGAFSLVRVGRMLLVTSGDGSLSALDVAHGELLWRFAAPRKVRLPPVVSGDVVLVATGGGRSHATLHGVDLFSGRELWSRELGAAPLTGPIEADGLGVIALGGRDGASLGAFDPKDGRLRWMMPDPGVGSGGSCLAVDRLLVVNGANGSVSALSLEDGQPRWERTLAHPVADDVPRRLEPILRGGALFVPSASVHVLRPVDGTPIGTPVPCELVPDWTRVDERGWIYVAEESGHLAALAPRPHLSLVR
ncbi:MAG: PQQ-binding-like beta-propeller repeat protein [Sandaracinaceae bacterium]